MKTGTSKGFGRSIRWTRVARERGGASAVMFTAAMPVVVLGFAITIDYSNASRFKARVKAAADVASIAACEAIAKNPRGAVGLAVDAFARRVAAATFAANAPSGAAGAPTVSVGGSASAVTTSVSYEGVAPSNFGDALGYGGLSVSASTTSPLLFGDASRPKIGS